MRIITPDTYFNSLAVEIQNKKYSHSFKLNAGDFINFDCDLTTADLATYNNIPVFLTDADIEYHKRQNIIKTIKLISKSKTLEITPSYKTKFKYFEFNNNNVTTMTYDTKDSLVEFVKFQAFKSSKKSYIKADVYDTSFDGTQYKYTAQDLDGINFGIAAVCQSQAQIDYGFCLIQANNNFYTVGTSIPEILVEYKINDDYLIEQNFTTLSVNNINSNYIFINDKLLQKYLNFGFLDDGQFVLFGCIFNIDDADFNFFEVDEPITLEIDFYCNPIFNIRKSQKVNFNAYYDNIYHYGLSEGSFSVPCVLRIPIYERAVVDNEDCAINKTCYRYPQAGISKKLGSLKVFFENDLKNLKKVYLYDEEINVENLDNFSPDSYSLYPDAKIYFQMKPLLDKYASAIYSRLFEPDPEYGQVAERLGYDGAGEIALTRTARNNKALGLLGVITSALNYRQKSLCEFLNICAETDDDGFLIIESLSNESLSNLIFYEKVRREKLWENIPIENLQNAFNVMKAYILYDDEKNYLDFSLTSYYQNIEKAYFQFPIQYIRKWDDSKVLNFVKSVPNKIKLTFPFNTFGQFTIPEFLELKNCQVIDDNFDNYNNKIQPSRVDINGRLSVYSPAYQYIEKATVNDNVGLFKIIAINNELTIVFDGYSDYTQQQFTITCFRQCDGTYICSGNLPKLTCYSYTIELVNNVERHYIIKNGVKLHVGTIIADNNTLYKQRHYFYNNGTDKYCTLEVAPVIGSETCTNDWYLIGQDIGIAGFPFQVASIFITIDNSPVDTGLYFIAGDPCFDAGNYKACNNVNSRIGPLNAIADKKPYLKLNSTLGEYDVCYVESGRFTATVEGIYE